MTKDEALKLALEALVSAYQGKDKTNQVTDAITAIKEALAQPEQEPVAYIKTVIEALYENSDPVSVEAAELLERIYTPPQRKPLSDEEVHDAVRESDLDWHQGWTLDDDEPNRFISLARAIEAAHGIKGEA